MVNIKVDYIETCTWELEGETFWCTHDQSVVDEYFYVTPGPNGPIEHTGLGYYCADCGEPLEGDPEADRQDYLAECQLMELLDK